MHAQNKISAAAIYALGFGLFLGLCIWKFGNPVILDHKIGTPATVSDYLTDSWPIHWVNWLGLVVVLAGVGWVACYGGRGRRFSFALWALPIVWLGWQFISALHSEDADLTRDTLWQFGGCVAGFFLGMTIFSRETLVRWLLVGILAAFAFCLVRAVNQRLFEYPVNLQVLTAGEQSGWTNFPPAIVAEMKTENIIITTNGADVANPAILTKFAKGRVSGTLVYPNALAQLILLLWPVALVLAFQSTRRLRPLVRITVILLACGMGGLSFFWTGSKLGWLIGLGLVGLVLLRRDWSGKLKILAVAGVLILGLGVFAVRFHQYFAAGATSVGARFDYWRAAAQTTAAQPWFGSGPGTFQRPYSRLKAPQSEMARLTHNDYLEQFSDSGIPAGLAYLSWVALALVICGRKLWRSQDHFSVAIFLGLLGWFAQGVGEFGLYVPALAWTAFTLLGLLAGQNDGPNAQKN